MMNTKTRSFCFAAFVRCSFLAILLAAPVALSATTYGDLDLSAENLPVPYTRAAGGAGDGMGVGNQNIAVADFNADGLDDYAVGYANYDPDAEDAGTQFGRVIIVYGGGQPNQVDLDSLPTRTVITNTSANANFGYALATGDVNDDGLPDLAIGAPLARGGLGVVTILFNDQLDTPGASITVNTNDPAPTSNESRLVGVDVGGSYGSSLACADLSGDGNAEVIGGAPNAAIGAGFNNGRVYVAFGTNITTGMTMDITSEPELYDIQGVDSAQLGTSLATGDIDGNGINELLVGAFGESKVYGFFGVNPGPNTMDLSDSGVFPMILRLGGYTSMGHAIAVGDENRDGFEDILMGMPLYSPSVARSQAGGAVFFRGRANLQGQNLDLTAPFIPDWAYFLGGTFGEEVGGQRYGAAVALGDLNGDGRADICLTAPFAPNLTGDVNAGRTAVVYSTAFLSGRDFFDGSSDLHIYGAGTNDLTGGAVNLDADLNGDGFADLIHTAPFDANGSGTGSGRVDTLYGAGDATSASAALALISGDTKRQGFGGDLTPVLRVSTKFNSGTNSTATATITRSKATIANLGNGSGSNVASVLWNLSTTRTLWTSAVLNFDYTDAETVGFDESNLSLYQAADPAGPWTEVSGATVSPAANRITAEVTTLGYFAIITNAPVISLLGDTGVTLECGEEWSEPGFTAIGAMGDDLTDLVVISGDTIDQTQLGTIYTINYDVEDGLGNIATTVSRTVEIVDTTAPEFTNTGTQFVEAGSVYTDTFDVIDCEELKDQVVITGDTVDTNTLGQYDRFLDVTDSSGNVAEQGVLYITVEDSTSPVISLVGDEEIVLNCGDTYTELGATATDWDQNLPEIAISSNVNTSVGGIYYVDYNVTDNSGNSALTKTRTVTVIDGASPEIVLSTPSIEVNCGSSSFGLPSFTVNDCEPDLEFDVIIGGKDLVNLTSVGTYFVTYNVSDAAGNAADEVSLEVNVVDKIKPQITVLGSNPMQIACGETYVDAGATATDNCGLAGPVQLLSNPVNTNIAGFYSVLYQVADAQGNTMGATRSVQVVGFCGTGIVEDCPAESVVANLPADNTVVGQGVPSEDGLDTVFEEYYSLDNLPTTKVTWWGYGLVNGDEPCDRNTNNFRISFYETLSLQSGVFPYGPPVYYEDVVPVVESTGFNTDENAPLLRYTATLENPFRIYPDFCCAQYFISIKGMGDSCIFQWHFSKDDDNRYATGPDSDNASIVEGKDLSLCLVQEAVAEGEGEALPTNHAADPDGNNIVDLSELVRLIQFYNAEFYGCLFGSEDGYGPDADADFCGYHSADYNPADWEINLSELLRLIQFYNYGGYTACPGQSEDNFCHGAP